MHREQGRTTLSSSWYTPRGCRCPRARRSARRMSRPGGSTVDTRSSPARVHTRRRNVAQSPSLSPSRPPEVRILYSFAMNRQIAHARLRNHRLSGRGDEQNAEELVRWFGAVQAQEYGHARWGLGLRLHGRGSDADVRRAVDEGRIVRTHVMRPTWHFVARADIRWLLDLTAPRVQ